jgi:hypothetical protein
LVEGSFKSGKILKIFTRCPCTKRGESLDLGGGGSLNLGARHTLIF